MVGRSVGCKGWEFDHFGLSIGWLAGRSVGLLILGRSVGRSVGIRFVIGRLYSTSVGRSPKGRSLFTGLSVGFGRSVSRSVEWSVYGLRSLSVSVCLGRLAGRLVSRSVAHRSPKSLSALALVVGRFNAKG
jgi:hypothetical protein